MNSGASRKVGFDSVRENAALGENVFARADATREKLCGHDSTHVSDLKTDSRTRRRNRPDTPNRVSGPRFR